MLDEIHPKKYYRAANQINNGVPMLIQQRQSLRQHDLLFVRQHQEYIREFQERVFQDRQYQIFSNPEVNVFAKEVCIFLMS